MSCIALANLRFPAIREASVALAERAVADAAAAGAGLVAFPQCFVPGYGRRGKQSSHRTVVSGTGMGDAAEACAKANVVAVIRTERVHGHALRDRARLAADGTFVGFQDQVQIDPSEEGTYSPGVGRRVFHAGPMTFGVVIWLLSRLSSAALP